MPSPVSWFGSPTVTSNQVTLTLTPVGAVNGGSYTDEDKVRLSKDGDVLLIQCAPGFSISGANFGSGGANPSGLTVTYPNGNLQIEVNDISAIPAFDPQGDGGEEYSFDVEGPGGIKFSIDPIIGSGGGGPGIINLN